MARNETAELLTLYPHQMKLAGLWGRLFGGGADAAATAKRMGSAVEGATDLFSGLRSAAKGEGMKGMGSGADALKSRYLAQVTGEAPSKGVIRGAGEAAEGTADVTGGAAKATDEAGKIIPGSEGITEEQLQAVADTATNPLLWAVPALGLGAAGGGAAGFFGGRELQRRKAEEEMKRRAMMAFGGGLAAGVAAPNLVRGASKILQTGSPMLSQATGQRPASPYGGYKFSSIYGVNQKTHPYLEAYEKEARLGDILGGAKKLLSRGKKTFESGVEYGRRGADLIPKTTTGAKRVIGTAGRGYGHLGRGLEEAAGTLGGGIEEAGRRGLDVLTRGTRRVEQALGYGPKATRGAAGAAGTAGAGAAKATGEAGKATGAAATGAAAGGGASKLKARGEAIKGKAPAAGARTEGGMGEAMKAKVGPDRPPSDVAAAGAGRHPYLEAAGEDADEVYKQLARGGREAGGAVTGGVEGAATSPGIWGRAAEFARANPLKTTGVALGVPAVGIGAGLAGREYGQHEAESRPLLQRVMGTDEPIMDTITSAIF